MESTFTYHVKNLLKEICFMFGHQVQKILAAVLGRLCTCVGGTRRRWVSQCHNLFCLYLRPGIFYIFPLLQSDASSLAKQGGAYFSAVYGSIEDLIVAPGLCNIQVA